LWQLQLEETAVKFLYEWQLQKLEVASRPTCAQNLISAAIYGIIKG
jgi:hypothetical protein